MKANIVIMREFRFKSFLSDTTSCQIARYPDEHIMFWHPVVKATNFAIT